MMKAEFKEGCGLSKCSGIYAPTPNLFWVKDHRVSVLIISIQSKTLDKTRDHLAMIGAYGALEHMTWKVWAWQNLGTEPDLFNWWDHPCIHNLWTSQYVL